ncbi:MAG: gamma-glutamylcyclotransferase [Methanococcoides sp.]|nr:gamma-glutamylcyclotransferase [Methanococcoides sp.]MCD4821639.1 gamma-glutamylcyclotransferase [Methanococcoides sp.]
MNFLFVYGTLKKGHKNHYLLAGSSFVSENCTEDNFQMLDMGDFPAVVKDDPVSSIVGELFSVDDSTLSAIDGFEGKWFCREEVLLKDSCVAWMYFLSDNVSYEGCSSIVPGIWLKDKGGSYE